jgi:hypothetical protein
MLHGAETLHCAENRRTTFLRTTAENRCVRHERSGLHVRNVTVARFRIPRTFFGAQGHQLELLTSQRTKRVSDLERCIGSITMLCS